MSVCGISTCTGAAAAAPRPREAVDDAVDERQREERQREPHQDLLRDRHGVERHDEHDGAGDEPAEERAQRDRHDAGTAERRDGLGQAGMMDVARDVGRIVAGREGDAFGRRVADGLRDVGAFAAAAIALIATCGTGGRHRFAGTRQLAVVADAPVRIAQYAAGMIDEAQRLFDVALAVTRLRVIFSDQPPQRRAHLLVGGGRRDTQRFVKRGSHLFGSAGHHPALMREYSGKSVPEARCRVQESRHIASRARFRQHSRRRQPTPGRLRARKKTGSRAAARLRDRDAAARRAIPAFPCACARASRGCAPTCRSDRGGSRASRGARRPCASPRCRR